MGQGSFKKKTETFMGTNPIEETSPAANTGLFLWKGGIIVVQQ